MLLPSPKSTKSLLGIKTLPKGDILKEQSQGNVSYREVDTSMLDE